MEDIIIEKTTKTPSVRFSFEENHLEISGVSIPEDAENFYDPLMQWITNYIAQKKGQTTKFVLKLIYFNTSTADYLVNMLKNLKELKEGYTEEDEYDEAMQQAKDSIDKAALASEKSFLDLQSEPNKDQDNGRHSSKQEGDEEEEQVESEFSDLNHPLKVEWHYEEEDEDMRETGTHFESIIDLPFTFTAVEEIE